jgi:hypothetical protein
MNFKTLSLRAITAIMLLSLPFLGSDCEDVINQIGGGTGGDLQGDWTLIFVSGTTHDICPGETVNYPNNSGGTATLKCPQQPQITRNYTVSGTTLTYTETGAEYRIQFTQNNELVLTGINNNRQLYYAEGIASDKSLNYENKNNSVLNSSEINK